MANWDTHRGRPKRDTHRGRLKRDTHRGTPKGHPPLRQRDTHRCTEWTTHRGAAVATTLDLAGTYDLAEAPADICGRTCRFSSPAAAPPTATGRRQSERTPRRATCRYDAALDQCGGGVRARGVDLGLTGKSDLAETGPETDGAIDWPGGRLEAVHIRRSTHPCPSRRTLGLAQFNGCSSMGIEPSRLPTMAATTLSPQVYFSRMRRLMRSLLSGRNLAV